MVSTIALAIFLIVLGLAALSDVRSRRIPNALTLTALIVAMLLRGVGGGMLDGFLGFGLAMLVVLPLFAVRGIGGGDAKLLMVVGAFLGPQGFLIALFGTAVAGGAMSLVECARRGVILPLVVSTAGLMKYYLTFGRQGERISLATAGAVSVPYGVAIAAGSTLAIFLGGGFS